MVIIHLLRITNAGHHFMGIVIGKGEACSLSFIFVVGLYRILQASGFPDNGNRAVAKGNQLGKTAGLKERWHQQGITACIDFMALLFRIVNLGRNPLRVLPSIVTEEILIAVLPCTQHNKLNFILADFIKDSYQKIQALLIRKTTNHTDQHTIRIHL